ncbi:MAG: LacI family transcriptional regulator [Roseateles sp.]|nr:MAG: LacI family transcriptional regulator [Roseateles sp.]
MAVEHLAGLGHRHIAHLAGPSGLSTGMTRRLGFEQALREQGLEPAGIAECEAYSIDAGVAAMSALLDAGGRRKTRPLFTAVVAANDLIALGALQVLKGRGIAVPEQLSLIGHNDMPLLDQISPPLSSIRIQHYEMGFRAARLLLEALQQTPGSSAATVLLRPTLIARASTQAPPA